MDKRTAISFCRHYHGEDKSPYRKDELSTLWNIERMWVELLSGNDNEPEIIQRAIQEYIAYGLGDFQMRDNVPLSLKAFILNRLIKYDERVDIEAFKKFYTDFYK